MSPISNTTITEVRDDVRLKALTDFTYFVGSVLGAYVPGEACAEVQRAVTDQVALEVETNHVTVLASTLRTWLESHGIKVHSPFAASTSELLAWLGLESRDDGYVACSLEVKDNVLRLVWL